jgi:hypothetical protein
MLSKSQRIIKEKKAYKSIDACLKSLYIIIKSCMCETNVGTTPIKKKGKLHKQNLHFSQEQLVQVTKLSDADMALFG